MELAELYEISRETYLHFHCVYYSNR